MIPEPRIIRNFFLFSFKSTRSDLILAKCYIFGRLINLTNFFSLKMDFKLISELQPKHVQSTFKKKKGYTTHFAKRRKYSHRIHTKCGVDVSTRPTMSIFKIQGASFVLRCSYNVSIFNRSTAVTNTVSVFFLFSNLFRIVRAHRTGLNFFFWYLCCRLHSQKIKYIFFNYRIR